MFSNRQQKSKAVILMPIGMMFLVLGLICCRGSFNRRPSSGPV